MSKFDTLRARWERMSEITEDVHDRLMRELKPLFIIYGHRGGDIKRIYLLRDDVVIEYTEYFRGEASSEELRIPNTVWNADDPVAAATGHKAQLAAQAEAAERARKLAEIDRLTRELGGTKP